MAAPFLFFCVHEMCKSQNIGVFAYSCIWYKIVYPINNCYFSYNVYFIFKMLSNIFENRIRYFSDYCEKGNVCKGTMFVLRIIVMIVEMVRNRQVCAPVQYYKLFINKSLCMKCVCSFIFRKNSQIVQMRLKSREPNPP